MSNRQSVLASLKKHGQSTYEDLEFGTGIARAPLRQAVNDAKKAGHIAVGKDVVTSQPAYAITKAGEVWLSEQNAVGEPKGKATVKKSLPVEEPKAAVVKDSLTTEKPINLDARIKELETALEERDDDIRRHIQRAEAAERNRDELKKTAESLAAERQNILDELYLVSTKKDRLHAENLALKILNESMPGFGATHQAITAGPFVVRRSGKPAVFAKKLDNAKAAALSAARQKLGAEVFAMIPVGKAVRGAEWKAQA